MVAAVMSIVSLIFSEDMQHCKLHADALASGRSPSPNVVFVLLFFAYCWIPSWSWLRNWNVQTADCGVTKEPARRRNGNRSHQPIRDGQRLKGGAFCASVGGVLRLHVSVETRGGKKGWALRRGGSGRSLIQSRSVWSIRPRDLWGRRGEEPKKGGGHPSYGIALESGEIKNFFLYLALRLLRS